MPRRRRRILARAPGRVDPRDGAHDFDFEIGAWKTHVKRLLHPLTGSTTWLEYDGTTTVTPVWNGRANLVQLEVSGAAGKIEALSLRLYNPETHQWSLNFSNSSGGTIGVPTIGEFENGRGEFYDQETLGTRAILVRFLITPRDASTIDFEQSFSADSGKTGGAELARHRHPHPGHTLAARFGNRRRSVA